MSYIAKYLIVTLSTWVEVNVFYFKFIMNSVWVIEEIYIKKYYWVIWSWFSYLLRQYDTLGIIENGLTKVTWTLCPFVVKIAAAAFTTTIESDCE